MKTKWGAAAETRSIRLNTDLARKPPECLEYIVVHEMVHLLEPTHNQRFVALMDQFMPKWHFTTETHLNRLPVRTSGIIDRSDVKGHRHLSTIEDSIRQIIVLIYPISS